MINSESTDNILANGFTMNQDSPSTMHTKLMPYKNYERMVPSKNHASQHSCKANSEILDDNSNRELFINPYTKVESKRANVNSLSKPNSFYKKQPYSSSISEQNSKKGSEKNITIKPAKRSVILQNSHQKRRSKPNSKNRSKNRNKELNASIESVEEFDANPVYIDTGGSNMQ
jgi:hypothetical protein